MPTTRLLALLAVTLAPFGCGGGGGGGGGAGTCTLRVGGAASEDLWCIATAYDYSAFPDPELASSEWVFEIVAYRGTYEVGAGGGVFLHGRPTVGTTYGWSGSVASTAIASGGFDRYGGSTSNGTYALTHSAFSLGNGWDGEGAVSVTFTAIPPPSATGEELLGVHGTLGATLPSLAGAGDVTLSATF